MSNTVVDQLKGFRNRIYNSFRYRADALFNLIDSLAGNTHAQSPVELSLSELFPRAYSSIHDAVVHFFKPTKKEKSREERAKSRRDRLLILSDFLPPPNQRPFWLLATDVTPAPRPFSRTLEDRGAVHSPNAVFGNKPVTIGHQFSVIAVLPEKKQQTILGFFHSALNESQLTAHHSRPDFNNSRRLSQIKNFLSVVI